MPAEWTDHQACLILYPHNPSTFRLEAARRQVEQVAIAIAVQGEEPVILYCLDEATRDDLQKRLLQVKEGQATPHQNLQLRICHSNDTWARDTAPTFVVEQNINSNSNSNTDQNPSFAQQQQQQQQQQRLIGLNWQFNAYGGPHDGCYWPCDLDCQIAPTICQQLHVPCESLDFILEGGSIHTDGQGTILTTRECLLHQNRNPQLSSQEIETKVLRALGATHMIWLPQGLAFDEDTNGHIDNFCCFVQPGQVVLAWTDDDVHDGENYLRCREALTVLQSERDAQGRSIRVHKLYLPRPIRYTQEEASSLAPMSFGGETIAHRSPGERMAASYVNFYIANQAVIVPQFGDDLFDAKAIETLSTLFPTRKVVGVPSKEILIGGGNIHCITQQVPRIHKKSKESTTGAVLCILGVVVSTDGC